MKIQLQTVTCKRCGHKWIPNKPEVKRCASCKSEYFNTKRVGRRGMRPEKAS